MSQNWGEEDWNKKSENSVGTGEEMGEKRTTVSDRWMTNCIWRGGGDISGQNGGY